jgi:transcriptional regulator with XRE-family HTH domain
MTFGQALRKAREEFDMSVEDLSDETGVNTGSISEYEREKRQPLLQTALRLSKHLGFSLDEIDCPGDS